MGMLREGINIKRKLLLSAWLIFSSMLFALVGCEAQKDETGAETITVIDQTGRTVKVPSKVERIAALHHFGGKAVFALGQSHKLVDQALYHRENHAMARINPVFASKPVILKGSGVSYEEMIALKPGVAFVYASFDRAEIEQMERARVRVVAIKGETLEQGYEGVRLVGKVLGCTERAEEYIADCRKLVEMVRGRVSDIPYERRATVMFAGPRSVYTVATGEMLTTEIINVAGGRNVAERLRGFWADVSPEQVALWNPEVIFLGSSLDTYAEDRVLSNPQFKTVKAVRNKRVYSFPSNIGWWDFPAPHCVLGVVWAAKTLYPDRFLDIDMTRIADDFYTKYMGHSFTAMGGKL
jgi:iron complex transport system substrate-binding protein